MTNYTTTITESSKELSVREKIKLKDLTSAIAIDKVVEPEKPLVIAPDFYASIIMFCRCTLLYPKISLDSII